MLNEWLFLFSTLLSIVFVFLASCFSREWLFGTIAVNLILIGIFGAKLISVFGIVTNVGNVFYACVFLATYFLIEKYGQRIGVVAVWFGLLSTAVFVTLATIASRYIGFDASSKVNGAIDTVFTFSPRVVLGSLVAYAFSQSMNVKIYGWLNVKASGRFLWLRANIANIISQFFDSAIFFSIAFFDLSGPLLIQSICLGWAIKSIVVFVGSPLLYIQRCLMRKK